MAKVPTWEELRVLSRLAVQLEGAAARSKGNEPTDLSLSDYDVAVGAAALRSMGGPERPSEESDRK